MFKKLKKYILLSYKLTKTTPLYGNSKPIDIIVDKSIKNGDTANTCILNFHNHSGTHIDAPKHFCDNGKTITDYSLNELIFRFPIIINCPKSAGQMIDVKDIIGYEKELKKCDLLLLKTGFDRYRNKEIYRLDNPGIAPELAKYLRSKFQNIRCLGIDTLSVSSYVNRELGRKTHKILLQKKGFKGEPMLIIEDMNLSNDEIMKLKTVIVAPLMIETIDGSPCMIIGEIK